MRLTIQQKSLADSLEIASHAVATRPPHPILNNVLLSSNVKNQKLIITTFNMSLGIRSECDCSVESNGTIALPAKLFEEVVSHLPKSNLAFEVNNNVAILTHETGKYQIQTANPEEFPVLPETKGTSVTLPVAKLQQILKTTLFAASRDQSKQIIAGVHFKFTNSSWEAVATDGHRLAFISGLLETKDILTVSEPVKATVPYQTLVELENLLGNISNSANCTISFDESIAVFEMPNVRVTSRLLEGQYPPYSSLLPTAFQYQFNVDRKALDSALKRVSIVAEHKNKIVKITCDTTNQSATLSTESPDVGGAVEVLPIEVGDTNENLEIGFNIKYLYDAVRNTCSEKVLLKANSPLQPIIITPLGGTTNHLIMVMPVQFSSPTRVLPKASETKELSEKLPAETSTAESNLSELSKEATAATEQETTISKKNKRKLVTV